MRVLVCGGRDYNNYDKVKEVLDGTRPDEIIHGNARGADTLAENYGKHHEIPTRVFPADWDKYGKRAGYVRNKQMLEEGRPELVIAFPGGKGTAMMIKIAKEANVEVIEVNGS